MARPANPPALSEFLARLVPAVVPGVRVLHRAVAASGAPFHVAVRYQMLTYALDGDFRHWVCAVDVGRSGFASFRGTPPPERALHLRFLYGVLLSDPGGLLRAGTSILKTLDFPPAAAIEAALVTAYVNEAVGRFEEFRASAHWFR